jgi:hypothetical protein
MGIEICSLIFGIGLRGNAALPGLGRGSLGGFGCQSGQGAGGRPLRLFGSLRPTRLRRMEEWVGGFPKKGNNGKKF